MIVSTSHRVCTIKNIDFTDFFNVFLSGATIMAPFSVFLWGDTMKRKLILIAAAILIVLLAIAVISILAQTPMPIG